MSKTIPQLDPAATLSLTNKIEVSQSDASSSESVRSDFQAVVDDIVNPNTQLESIDQVTGLPAALATKASTLQEAYDNSGNPATIKLVENEGILITNSEDENLVIISDDATVIFTPVSISQDGTEGLSVLGSSDPPSTMFEVLSTNKGAKPVPAWSKTVRDSIPTDGIVNYLFGYNTTNETFDYRDSNDWQQLLSIGHIIQGTNMSIVTNGDGTVTFNSSGGGAPSDQVSGSFTVNENATSTTPSSSVFSAVAIDDAKFDATRQSGMSVTVATVDGVETPIITNTAAGGVRYGSIAFDFSINPSFSSGQLYTFAIAIKRLGGGVEITNCRANFAAPTIATTGSFKPISISSGLIGLGTNDYAYLAVLSNIASQPFVAYNLNGRFIDTTVASLPDTDALIQGSNNLYLSQNSGSTYQNVSGSLVVGNLTKANTTGGQLIDSGIPFDDVVLTSGNQDISGIKTFSGSSVNGSYIQPDGSDINIFSGIGSSFNFTYEGTGDWGDSTLLTLGCGFNYQDGAGSSSYSLQAILDKGNLNYVQRIVGANATQGTRVLFGGDSRPGSYIDNFSINTSFLSNPHLGALFEMSSTTQGALLSRMTNAQMNAVDVSDTPTSLLLYTTNSTKGFRYWDSSWHTILSDDNVTGDITFSTAGVGTIANNAITPSKVASDTYNITVNNGVVTTGSYANPAWITSLASSKITGLNASSMVVTDGSSVLASAALPLGINAIVTSSTSTQSMSLQTRYIVTYSGGQMVGTLPAATGTGKTIEVLGASTASTSGWKLNAVGSDKIQFGSALGAAAGSLTSTVGSATDCVTLIDAATNLWVVYPALGLNLTVA